MAGAVLDLFSLKGTVAVVTGAGSGIGKAIATALAESGAKVLLAARSEAVLAVAESIRGEGAEAVAERADVTREEDVRNLMARAETTWGRLDVVFCNAGVSDYFKPAYELSRPEFEAVLQVNLVGVFLTAREAARHMIPQRRGKIVTVASVWGEVASADIPAPAYVSSKAGVIGLTKELAMELLPYGITVNALSPGFVVTNIGRDKAPPGETIERLLASAHARTPIHRHLQPEELRGTAVYLASRASDALNGHVLTVDGGMLAC
jgi:NAD(P)-dependent dehydrogenase (short-subunit alcohol dehydrogenase family)